MEAKERRTEGKITYATMNPEQMESLHLEIEQALDQVRLQLGQTHSMFMNGEATQAHEQFADTSPIDTRIVLGYFQKGTREHTREAIEAAATAYPSWSSRPWQDRVALMRQVADTIRAHRLELSALMGYEVGKNRLECLSDVEESADLIAYYCDQMEENGGFIRTMGKLSEHEENVSILRPYGVWAVISPFNFPMALAAGPSGGALVSGNTVVFKPASDTPYLGLKLYEVMAEAGLPQGVFNYVTGGGDTVGHELIDNSQVAGIVFTGSKEVGMCLARENAKQPTPRPLITEMGGKNPAIVTRSADLDRATDGVMRSAFGAQGQKCSACSCVYVSREVRAQFVEQLVEKTRKLKVGNPLERDVWLGPVINENAVKTYERAIEVAKRDGGKILIGGRRLKEGPFEYGNFVEPTVIDSLPKEHPLFSEELFVPITLVADVLSIDEGIDLANRTEYGLTAGIFSEDEKEIERFFNRIQAGVLYANRRAGATTGAWPGINPFGGWKASGSTGRGSGGPYYIQQFMREQSRVRVH